MQQVNTDSIPTTLDGFIKIKNKYQLYSHKLSNQTRTTLLAIQESFICHSEEIIGVPSVGEQFSEYESSTLKYDLFDWLDHLKDTLKEGNTNRFFILEEPSDYGQRVNIYIKEDESLFIFTAKTSPSELNFNKFTGSINNCDILSKEYMNPKILKRFLKSKKHPPQNKKL